MPMIENWKSQPVENEIVLTLIKNRGEMLTSDLFRVLSNTYQDFSRQELNQILFKLEVRGLILVTPIKKDISKIEVNKIAKFSPEIARQLKEFMH